VSSVERSSVERRAFQRRASGVPVSSVERSSVERRAFQRRAFQCRASSVPVSSVGRSSVERRAFQCRVSSVPASSVECSNVERRASLSRPSMVFLALNVNSPVLLLQLPSPLTSLPSPDAAASGVHRSCRSGSTTIRRIPRAHRQDRASDARRHHVHGNPNLSLRPPATHSIGSISNTMPPPLVLPRGHGQVCRVRSPLELSTSRHSSITSPVLSTVDTQMLTLDARLDSEYSMLPTLQPCKLGFPLFHRSHHVLPLHPYSYTCPLSRAGYQPFVCSPTHICCPHPSCSLLLSRSLLVASESRLPQLATCKSSQCTWDIQSLHLPLHKLGIGTTRHRRLHAT
jgi:hypothetical protein